MPCNAAKEEGDSIMGWMKVLRHPLCLSEARVVSNIHFYYWRVEKKYLVYAQNRELAKPVVRLSLNREHTRTHVHSSDKMLWPCHFSVAWVSAAAAAQDPFEPLPPFELMGFKNSKRSSWLDRADNILGATSQKRRDLTISDARVPIWRALITILDNWKRCLHCLVWDRVYFAI